MKILDTKNKIYLLDDDNFDFPTLDMMSDDLVAREISREEYFKILGKKK